MWLLAGLWHTVLATTFYRTHTGAEHEGTGSILVAYLILSALMVVLYPDPWWPGRPRLSDMAFGAVIGLLWVFPHALAMAGAHGESVRYAIENAAWHLAEQGVGGLLIGVVCRRSR